MTRMASSQVAFASSAPFGCVLRDNNRSEGCSRESAAPAAAFHKNLKQLVNDCIYVYPDSTPNDENSRPNRNLRINKKTEKTEEKSISPRHARILNRWKRAREMVSINIETSRTHEAESTGAQNLGASALVQMWEARLHRSNGIKGSKSGDDELSKTHETSDSANERLETRTNNDESLTDWESQSDRTAQSEPPTLSHSMSSDAGESERVVRVADIIRRLADNNDHEQHSIGASNSPSRRLSAGSDQVEARGALMQVVCSPKIRGRQAFNALLVQMEGDRKQEISSLGERQVVSRFAQRGRIQSMLRLRLLQRAMTTQDQLRSKSQPSPQLSRLKQGFGIVHIRETFSSATEQVMMTCSGTATLRSPDRETVANSGTATPRTLDREMVAPDATATPTSPDREMVAHGATATPRSPDRETIAYGSTATPRSPDREMVTSMEESPTLKRLGEDNQSLEISASEKKGTAQEEHTMAERSDVSKDPHEATGPISDVMWQETNLDNRNMNMHENAEATGPLNGSNDTEIEEEQEADEPLEILDLTYDWFSDVARPQSYWEDRRQAWYEEMLGSSSANEEIRQLLERQTVSNFLSSDFRDRMDRLMTCHAQRQMDTTSNQEDEQDNDDCQERMHQCTLAGLQRHTQQADYREGDANEEDDENNNENEAEVEMQEQESGREVRGEEDAAGQSEEDDEGERGIDKVEEQREELEVRGRAVAIEEQPIPEAYNAQIYEERDTPMSHLYLETSDYFSHSSQPSPFRSWSYRSHEISDDSDQAPSISSQQHPQILPYHQDNRQCSFSTNHPSLEMELICDLRGHMVQMQQEMLELRKSIQSCLKMKMQCQNSMKREAHSVQEDANNSLDMALKNRRCCICYEMQVDSLLYRCGHMCTCLRCAHELQWNSGKCPICRAPIDDVVRAFLD